MAPEPVGKGLGAGEQGLERFAAARTDEIVGILAGRQLDEAQGALGADEGQGAQCRPDRRLLAGAVAVEAEDRRGIEAPHPFELCFGHRGAVGRDRFRDPGAVERDHIHVALDHDQPFRGAAGGRGAIDVVEGAALVEERRIGRVEVFRLARAEDPPAERDDPAARIADRDHQPAAEAVVALTLLGLNQHAGLDQPVLAQPVERALERGAAVGGEAEAEALDGGRVDAAALEIVARLGAGEAVELLGVISGNLAHDVGQRSRAVGALFGPGVGLGNVHPGLGGKLLDRIHERHPALVGQKADRVAVRTAAEAMVEALVVVDGEARRLLVVEWATCLPFAPGADQLHRRRDDGGEDRSSAKLVEKGGA